MVIVTVPTLINNPEINRLPVLHPRTNRQDESTFAAVQRIGNGVTQTAASAKRIELLRKRNVVNGSKGELLLI